jgi:hypothetical protein
LSTFYLAFISVRQSGNLCQEFRRRDRKTVVFMTLGRHPTRLKTFTTFHFCIAGHRPDRPGIGRRDRKTVVFMTLGRHPTRLKKFYQYYFSFLHCRA